MTTMYHIGLDETIGAKYALLPGDPKRVLEIAKFLDNAREIAVNREYTSWLGEVDGEKVLVMSTGMGGPSTAIAVEELKQIGLETLIRIGTSGGIHHDVKAGDLVIANASIRMEGTTREYVPIEFPAVSNFEVSLALKQACEKNAYRHHIGVVHCKDSFYGQHAPERMPVSYDLEHKWEAWKRSGTLASEMESSALYIVSQVLGMRASCILNVIWNKDREKAGFHEAEQHDMTAAITAALDAIRILIHEDKNGY